jgi:hypothetical protein
LSDVRQYDLEKLTRNKSSEDEFYASEVASFEWYAIDQYNAKSDIPTRTYVRPEVNTDISSWAQTPIAVGLINGLLSDLEFPDLSIREKRITEAHDNTFE